MTTDHITVAFDMLVEEFERAVTELNTHGAEAFVRKDYKAVNETASIATRLTEFQKKVVSLEEEWNKHSAGFANESSNRTRKSPPPVPAKFHALCVHAVQKKCGFELQKQTRSSYATADNRVGIVCSVSREHIGKNGPFFWFGFHPDQAARLKDYVDSYLVLGCGSEKRILKIPFHDAEPWTKKMNTTQRHGAFYWHIRITQEKGRYTLHLKGQGDTVDLTPYLL